jgi:anti-anti-sigma factor
MQEPLAIAVREGTRTVVTLTGDLDLATVTTLRDVLQQVDGADLVVDCTDLRFLDSTGISLFVSIHTDRERAGRTMILRNVAGIPRRALELCGLLETLESPDGH